MVRRLLRLSSAAAPLLLLLCLLYDPPLSFAIEPPSIPVEQITTDKEINRDMAVLEDPKRSLTPEEILSPAIQERFALNKEGKRNFGFTRSVFWFHLKLASTQGGGENRILTLSYPLIGSVELFRQVDGQLVKRGKAGVFYPFGEWAMDSPNPSFALSIPAAGTADYYLRVQSNQVMNLHFSLATPPAFESRSHESSGILLAIISAWAVMIVYNLFILISLRDKNYLLYLVENLSTFMAALALKGASFKYLYPSAPYWALHGLHLYVGLLQLFIALFTISFVDTRRMAPRTHRFAVWYCYYTVFFLFLVFLYPDELAISFLVYANIQLVSLTVYSTLIEASIRGSRQARIMLLATIFPIIGSVTYELGHTGIIGEPLLAENGAILGWLFEMLVLSLALADRVKILQAEKVAAQQVALETVQGARDTLETKVAERTMELGESEARFRSLAEAAAEAILIHDGGIILDMNGMAETMMGWRRNELIGQNGLELIVSPESVEEVQKQMAAQSEQPYEAVMIKKDGTLFPAEIRGSQIAFRGKNSRVISIRDLTERKAAELQLMRSKEQAEAATRLKDKFVSLVTHDLKSPLASLATGLEFLNNDHELSERNRQFVGKMAAHSRELLKMTERLLDLSRLQTGRIIPQKRFINCRQFAAAQIELYRTTATQKEITIANELPNTMKVYADPDLFAECLKNLLSNALKFCGKSDTVAVCNPSDMPSTIAVKDNGPGIAPDKMPSLFAADMKTRSLGTAGEKGTGIGLIHVKEIMEAHGGSITVESEYGKGCAFFLMLPHIYNITVLVVDDQEVVRAAIREHCAGTFPGILEAGNGMEALEILKNVTPNLIITDINMPVMNGLEFIQQVRNDGFVRRIPIIAMTSDESWPTPNGMDIRSYCLHIGADDFVNKPVAANDLVPRASRLLSSIQEASK